MQLRKRNMLIYGFGINDADYEVVKSDYVVDSQGSRKRKQIWVCPYYTTWRNMLRRCYNKASLKTHHTYGSCSVCEEWIYFSVFKSWMEKQDWQGKNLDKDFLRGEDKIYSPETCVFISQKLNKFITVKTKVREGLLAGVSPQSFCNNFTANCNDGDKGSTYIGSFKTAFEAHKAWQKAKLKYAKVHLADPDNQDARVQKGIQRIIDKLQYDLDNDLETTSF